MQEYTESTVVCYSRSWRLWSD